MNDLSTDPHTPLIRSRTPVLVVALATIPGALLLLWLYLMKDSPPSITEMLVYPLLFGAGLLVLIVALNKYLCRDTIASFSRPTSTIGRDLGIGLGLLLIYIAWTVVDQFTIRRWFPAAGPPAEIQLLMRELSSNPLLLAIWLGPVVWIGVALFEELYRAFFFKSLWSVWNDRTAVWVIVVLSGIVTGSMHAYQSVAGMISTGMMGMIAAVVYMKYRRLLPLIVAHALYDSAWIVFGVVMMH